MIFRFIVNYIIKQFIHTNYLSVDNHTITRSEMTKVYMKKQLRIFQIIGKMILFIDYAH